MMTGRVDRWSDSSRKWIPILVFLTLIPVTLHVWSQMFAFLGDLGVFPFYVFLDWMHWNLIEIGNEVP